MFIIHFKKLSMAYIKKTKPSKFRQDSYNRHNEWGISRIKTLLKKKGYNIIQKEEDFGIDIKADKNGLIYLFEVETKTGYPFKDKKSFKFETVSFLARKSKWVSTPFWYIIICKETESLVCCNSDVIFKEKYKEKIAINSYERKGVDEFYRVPKDLCYWYQL